MNALQLAAAEVERQTGALARSVSSDQARALEGLCDAIRAVHQASPGSHGEAVTAGLEAVRAIAQSLAPVTAAASAWRGHITPVPNLGGSLLVLADQAGRHELRFSLDAAGAVYFGSLSLTGLAPADTSIAFHVRRSGGAWELQADDGARANGLRLGTQIPGLAWTNSPELREKASDVGSTLGDLAKELGQALMEEGLDEAVEYAGEQLGERAGQKLGATKPLAARAACPECGTNNPPDNKFCAQCGASLRAGPGPRATFCGQCGAPLKPADKFCTRCGHPAAG